MNYTVQIDTGLTLNFEQGVGNLSYKPWLSSLIVCFVLTVDDEGNNFKRLMLIAKTDLCLEAEARCD